MKVLESLMRTPLHAKHLEKGGRMVPFGGWDMPVQYSGVMAEHLAVRSSVGVFDVSHMGEFCISGRGALEFLQFVTANDLSKLRVGRAQYNMLPNARGGLVDDVYVYRLNEFEYLMVVNASNIDKDFVHLSQLKAGFEATLENVSDQYALLAIQGPQAEATLQPHTHTDLSNKKKNDVFSLELFGKEVLLARTGYTGEDGFEIFCNPQDSHALWDALLEHGATPCGLGARDTLRLEAGFPLYGHEFSEDLNPLETHMAWAVKTGKEFYGKAALLERPLKHRLVGLELEGRGIPREGYRVLHNGKDIGYVSSGTMSPTFKKGIALAFLERNLVFGHDLEPGSSVQVEIRGQGVGARVVEPVFLSKSV
ncbi:MAG: glycine cleavage system aminomethyltransferase GcvT [Pseudopedobacter sp.]|nr:glycine cleavage system aminomethyltransferase GcvT [Deinococcales bacterium]